VCLNAFGVGWSYTACSRLNIGAGCFNDGPELMHAFRKLYFLAACLASLICNCQAAFSATTQLLSFSDIKLQPLKRGVRSTGEYVARFDIKTWGVRVIAVCHIPGGWTISAGKNADPEGVLSGSAGEGVAFLDAEGLHQLTDLFLVQVDDYHPVAKGDCANSCTPASFTGNFYIGEYGADAQPTPQRVIPENIRLTAATRCPDPH
jgi:hypothetical protein